MTAEPPNPAPGQGVREQLVTALACHQRGDIKTARAMYEAVLRDHPRCFDALHLLGVLNADTGALDQGIGLIRAALDVEPTHATAHFSLASALLRKGDQRSALACLDRALELQPEFADAWFLRGNLLQQLEHLEPALECYRRAIRARPGFPEAFNNSAAAHRALRRLPDALESVNQALALQPSYPKALNNRGLILLDCAQGSLAVDDFRRATAIDPQFAEALHNLGTALAQLRRFEEARDAFAQLAAIAPQFPHIQGNWLLAKLNCCDWSAFGDSVDRVTQAVERGEQAAVPMLLLCICDSAALQLRCATLYTDTYYPARVAPGERRFRRTHGKIRVAYLSGDLGEHAITYLLAGVFERHDPARYETFALSWDRRDPGPVRRRVEAAFSRFIDISSKSDAEVTRLMEELQIDIAVDLSGHTLGQRTGILARRAAPVQVNYLGLPATMGAPYIDYLIADPFLVPPDHQNHYAERIVWLPESFQPNDNRRSLPADAVARSAFGLPEAGFVFCCFNRSNKLNPACFDVWMRLLKSVPGSVLWLLANGAVTREHLRREALVRGVDGDRVIFAGDVPYGEYLARYACADLFLDTLPFNGGTTVSDALTMSLPVLTCSGDSFAARMAGSVLMCLGHRELVTRSMDEYAAAALHLASHPGHLKALRRKLAQQRAEHPFFNTDRYRRHLEEAYRLMWERHSSGLPPAAISVAPEDQGRSGNAGDPQD